MFDIRPKISARLKACRAAKGWTFKETAQNLSIIVQNEVIPSRYGNWELGINIPPGDMLIALGQLFGKPAAWLSALSDDDGTSPEASRYTVPIAEPIATSNGMIDLGSDALAFRKTFLKRHKLDRERLLLVAAPDDSMSGVITKDDQVLIDLTDTKVRQDDLFALIINGRLWLRWIRQNIDGSYCIQAELRERFPDEEVSAQTMESMHILGRVRLIAHLR
jgi:transcriptional regulator with XRE-family HTH domain